MKTKKILSYLLALVLVLGLLPTSALAADAGGDVSYPLWVGGVQVTCANAADVLGDGTVKFEVVDGENILTLNNATITGTYYVENLSRSFNIYGGDSSFALTINSVGKNTVKDGQHAIQIMGALTLTGAGSLDAACASGGFSAISSYGEMTIDGTTVHAAGVYFGLWTIGTLTVKGSSSVTAKAPSQAAVYASNNLALQDGLEILEPEGGVYQDKFIRTSDGGYATEVVIGKRLYPLWVGGTQVTSANAADVLGDGTVSYAPEANTLYLANASINTTDLYLYDTMGVRYEGHEDFTISVSGTCSITETADDDVRSTGILIGSYAGSAAAEGETEEDDFDVTIELAKDAVLTIVGGDVAPRGSMEAFTSCGLRNNSSGGMTVRGAGTLNLCGGSSDAESVGLLTSGDLIVEEGVTLNCSAKDAGRSSFALGVGGDFILDGAAVTTEPGEGQFSAGMQVMGNIDLED